MDLLSLIAACAPMVAPTTMKAIVLEESRGHPYAIHDGATGTAIFPETKEEAVAAARRLIARGVRIDAGLTQINSANWSWLGLDDERVFDSCFNLAAAERVLIDAYSASPYTVDAALSRYNTGHAKRGIGNGYVGRVKAWMAKPQPTRRYLVEGIATDSAKNGASVTARATIDTAVEPVGEGAESIGAGTPNVPSARTPAWHFEPVADGFGGGG